MAHHEYAEYLLEEVHREYDSIKHEEIVIKLLPEFGEAFLNCAKAYLGIGNTQRALVFAEQAGNLSPKYMDSVTYEYWVSMVKWQAFQDLGNIPLAQESFNRCYELVQKEPLCNDIELKQNIESLKNDTRHWEHAEQLVSLRQKEFGEKLFYRIPSLNIELCLPGDWKIDRESFTEDTVVIIFAPTATWNETSQCPNDASIDVLYTTQHRALDAKSFGEMSLESIKGIDKTESVLAEGPKTFNQVTFCRWNFKIRGSWPKEGILMTFATPTSMIQMQVMCQICGKNIFWPILTSTAETFAQKLINMPNWKFQK
jgi:tetratricopeptide (TPR) repeat protein